MNVVIRTDASIEIGTGHVMRCVTLANQLKREGVTIIFICRNFPGNSISYIQSQGFTVYSLQSPLVKNHLEWTRENRKQDTEETCLIIKKLDIKIDLLIVDQYGLDVNYERELRPNVKHIMVIDDLADRQHDCDILLDQNFYPHMEGRYKGLVPNYCIQLLGPDYVLLREEFLSIDIKNIKRNGKINKILIFFGGTDPTCETIKALQAIRDFNQPNIKVDVVVGAANPFKNKIEQVCEKMSNVEYHCQINNMADLLLNTDLAIGAGGTTLWERSYVGLPSITIIVADNQRAVTNAVAEKGGLLCLGDSAVVTAKMISMEISNFYYNPTKVTEMVQSCWKIVKPSLVKERLVKKNILRLLK